MRRDECVAVADATRPAQAPAVKSAFRIVVAAQGLYYLVTGIWPLVSMSSFELFTGPKIEHWLVHTVSLLALAIGMSLVAAAKMGDDAIGTRVLAVGTALAFASMDLYYVGVGRISPVYLLDAAAELAFALSIVIVLVRSRSARQAEG